MMLFALVLSVNQVLQKVSRQVAVVPAFDEIAQPQLLVLNGTFGLK